ncbi:MAG: LPS translocon maturation chaperone LptM [Formosimonas sp.]
MRTSTRLFFIVALAALVVSACGYRGALYLPENAPAPKTSPLK